MESFVEHIKQHPGQVQVMRKVVVGVPGIETVFSGAGKFMQEAPSTGPELLQRMTKLHHNWKYPFLRPTNAIVVQRYKEKFKHEFQAPPAPTPAPAPALAPAVRESSRTRSCSPCV